MPTYVAFLRAINLGAKRKFAKDAIVRATEAAGGTGVETYLNTGNVRLTHGARSPGKVRTALEKAYVAEAGFEVSTVVFEADQLAALVDRADELHAEHDPAGKHYVTLYQTAPPAAAISALDALDAAGEVCVVQGRAAYTLLAGDIKDSRLLRAKEFAALGQGTARTVNVLRTVRERWC